MNLLKRKPVSNETRQKKIFVFNVIAVVILVILLQQTNYHYNAIGNELSYRNYLMKDDIKINSLIEPAKDYSKVNTTGINIFYIICIIILVICTVSNLFDMIDLYSKKDKFIKIE